MLCLKIFPVVPHGKYLKKQKMGPYRVRNIEKLAQENIASSTEPRPTPGPPPPGHLATKPLQGQPHQRIPRPESSQSLTLANAVVLGQLLHLLVYRSPASTQDSQESYPMMSSTPEPRVRSEREELSLVG